MPAGYLLTVLLLGLSTYCALWPPGKGRSRLSTAAYMIGMTFSEAPVFPLLLGAAATALAAAEGDTSSPAGAVGAAGMALVAAGLLLTQWRAVRSSAAPARALNQGLPAGWHGSSTGPEHAPFGLRGVLAGIFLPFRRRVAGVRHIRNVQYGPEGKYNTLDLYLPRGGPQAGPVFVHFHGGRFVSGAKDREALYLLYLLASRGWSCISANYRLAPRARFPEYVVDAKRVIAWVRTQGTGHGVGTGPPVVAGSSAGAFLAAFTALTANRAELQPGFGETDTSVAAAVCLYGYYGRVAGEDPGSTPAAYARPDAPPFLILHGHQDSVVPVGHAGDFAQMLRGVSRRPVVWCPLPGAQHSFDYFASVRSRAAAAAISDFAGWAVAQNEPPV